MPLTSALLFFFSDLRLSLFVSLVGVISNQNISSGWPEPESSPGQAGGKSARSTVRRETALVLDQTKEKKKKKWVAVIPLIAETVRRRPDKFSRGRWFVPLMRISYEDTQEKQRWFQGGTVIFHTQNSTHEANM